MKEALKLLGAAVVVLLLVWFIGVKVISVPAPAVIAPATTEKTAIQIQNEAHQEMAEAYRIATKAVASNLKDPADAKFSALGSDGLAEIRPYGFRQWQCIGFVDSLNSFGGKARENWSVVLFKNGERSHAYYTSIGTSEYGSLPERIAFPKK